MADGRLRALIVDDEPAARTRLSLLCAELPRLEVIGTAGDGVEALARLDRDPIDVLFLDIEMPGMDGMSLARRLGEREGAPAVVFVTAFERFAVAAFGVHAAGYVLKPVDPETLSAVVERLAVRPDCFSAPPSTPPVFWAPHRGDLVSVAAREVEWVEAEGDYVRLHLPGRSYLLSERLYDLGERLAAWRFVRVHRSALVNLEHVRALAHTGKGAWLIRTHAGCDLPIGRSHLQEVRAALSR